jgi:perosamine synthetase
VAVSSGTAALDIAVKALDLGPGDEVLVPSLTIISCGRAVVQSGARLVPVDCDPSDWNAQLANFEARLTSRTRAVMLVHLYGLCADLTPILEWAARHGLRVIEDASQAMGLRHRERQCGSYGDISAFSLYANKLITTGEGGMVLCDSPALAARCRQLRNLCFGVERRFWHEELGWNYRMGALQAALGLPQLARLTTLVQKKRDMGQRYRCGFQNQRWLHMAPATTGYADNVYWVFGVVVAEDAPFDRDQLVAFLTREGIGSRNFFYGLHQQPALLKTGLLDPAPLPTTESLAERGLYLPSGLGLTPDDQSRVIDTTVRFLQAYA